METVTRKDREKELRVLMARIEAKPSHDWEHERQRIKVLREMIAAPHAGAGG